MKKPAVWLLFFTLLACDKDTFFSEQYQPVYKTYPFFFDSGDCSSIYARMVSETEAIVYTGSYSLYTDDSFETLSYYLYQSGYFCNSKTLFYDGINLWLRDNQNFRYELRQATSTKTFDVNQMVYDPPVLFSKKGEPLFLDSAHMIIPVLDYEYNANTGNSKSVISLYAGDVFLNTASKTISFDNTSQLNPVGLYSTGNHLISLSVENSFPAVNYYLHLSEDGALWEGPYAFPTLTNTERIESTSGNGNLIVMQVGSYVTYNSDHKISYKVYLSRNKGATWQAVSNLNGEVLHMQVLDEKTIFSVVKQSDGDKGTISKLGKSTDGGFTWSVEEPLIYAEQISFFDAMNGLAFTTDALQITSDGGKTWKPVIP